MVVDAASRGWQIQNFAIPFASTSVALPKAQINFYRVNTLVAVTISNVLVYFFTGGSGLTASQCFAGVYSATGTLLGVSADQSTAWASSGLKTMAQTVQSGQSLSVAAGTYFIVALMVNGTTAPSPQGAPTYQLDNAGVSGLGVYNGFSSAATTSLPGTLSGATAGNGTVLPWIGVS